MQGGKKGWREGEKRERGRGKGRMAGRMEECAKDNETHKTPTPLPDNNFIIITNTFH